MTLAAVTATAVRFGAPVYLVGGAVRDRLRGVDPLDVDVAVEGDGIAFARQLACDHGWRIVVVHEPFGTAEVVGPDGVVDVASTRTEVYGSPGGLPVVTLGASIVADLARRDFTINALARPLLGDGVVLDPFGGVLDIEAGLVRVLHDGSFADDPTRIIRAARYAARLSFAIEPHTTELVRDGLSGLGRLSNDRRESALALALDEVSADRVVDSLLALGAGGELGLDGDGAMVRDADELARSCAPDAVRGRYRAATLGLGAVRPGSLEALVALAVRDPARRRSIERYLVHDRHVRTELDGADVMRELAIPPGPRVGAVLAELLARKVAGELPDRAAELVAVRTMGGLAAP